ncbi:MAG: glucose 1-dehydrogenase [Gammaproteobacteria bacterium]|jgi:cyclopentanol dehydrogenase
MNQRLQGKVVLITGAARGMGACEARLCAAEGARLVLGDMLETRLNELASELEQTGYEVAAMRQDVTKEQDWQAMMDLARQRFGCLDVLVNNAGILDTSGVEDTTLDTWERVIAVNQTGVWLGMKAVTPLMKEFGGGSIVNKSSIYGIVGSGGSAAYHASKGAVRILTKTAALELAVHGIRVNSVHPGFIQTPMIEQALPEVNEPVLDLISQQVPLGRVGQPEDIARGVLYLASDESSYVTGTELVIDGGVTAR